MSRTAADPPPDDAALDDAAPDDAALAEGGDPACWLSYVCQACGRFVEDRRATHCPRCGHELEAD